MNWRKHTSWILYLGILAGALALALHLMTKGIGHVLIVGSITAGASLLLFLLQRFMTYEEGWRRWVRVLGVDVLHGAFSTIGAVALFEAILIGLVFHGQVSASQWIGATLWPTELPLAAQFGLAIILGDLGAYAFHRLAHTVPLLWRLHALHHSSEQLYVLSSARTHPINAVLTYLTHGFPLVVLGAGPEVILLLGVFTTVHGMLQHANIDFRLGALNWILAGPELHRWHHSDQLEESQTNYGSNTILWDIVFGTRYLPGDGRLPVKVGLPEMVYPRNFLKHLASPFEFNTLFRDEEPDPPLEEADTPA